MKRLRPGGIADQLLWGYYRERFLPAPHERPALPPAPSTRYRGVEIFVGSTVLAQNERLQVERSTVTEILPEGGFRLSNGATVTAAQCQGPVI